MDLIAGCIDPELDNPDSTNQYIEELERINPFNNAAAILCRA